MTRLSKLTKVAESALSRLDRHFPYYNIYDLHDPRQFNAIYPEYEWKVERPQSLDNQVRHCDTTRTSSIGNNASCVIIC